MSSSIEWLQGHVQHYSWGVKGGDSLVAQLRAAADESYEIDESKPFAEVILSSFAPH
jgi:hypothetical protein